MSLQEPSTTIIVQNFFCRLPTASITGFIVGTYKNHGLGGQWYGGRRSWKSLQEISLALRKLQGLRYVIVDCKCSNIVSLVIASNLLFWTPGPAAVSEGANNRSGLPQSALMPCQCGRLHHGPLRVRDDRHASHPAASQLLDAASEGARST